MTWVDKAIASVSPRWAFRREQYRRALGMMAQERRFDGARRDHRTAGWQATGASATAEIASSIKLLRDRSRQLHRDNPYAKRMRSAFVANTVGAGVKPLWDTDEAQVLWEEWTQQADADQITTLYGLQGLATSAQYESGEVFARIRPRTARDGLRVPLQVQLLEPDHLDMSRTEQLADGGFILCGIEFDAIGRRRAYWLWPEHPGEVASITRARWESRRVPAASVIHLFTRTRPGQQLGVPELHASMLRMRDLDEFQDAELLKQKIAACFAVFLEQAGDPTGLVDSANGKSKGGYDLEAIEPGMIERLQPGDKPHFAKPEISTAFGQFSKAHMQAVAVGGFSTYEQASGDLSEVNYSSIRAGMIEYRAMVEQWRWATFVPQFCAPIARAFATYALAAGLPALPKVRDWTPPRVPWVDPEKEIKAEILAIQYALKSHRESLREQGYDPDVVMAEVIQEMGELAGAGVTLPRFEKQSGGAASNSNQEQSNG